MHCNFAGFSMPEIRIERGRAEKSGTLLYLHHATSVCKGTIVRRITAVISAIVAVAICTTSGAAGAESGGYYCPPGAKFCPAPGADNTAFNNTHYGMDLATGQVTAYTGSTVQAADNSHLETGETLILVAPTVSPENIFVPPEVAFGGSASARNQYLPQPPAATYVTQYPPQPRMQAPAPTVAYGSPYPSQPQHVQPYPVQPQAPVPAYPSQPQYVQPYPAQPQAPAPAPSVAYGSPYPAQPQQFQPVPVQVPAQQPRQTPRVVTNYRDTEPHSEVANQTSRRTPKENVANDEKVPWWKGGMWRNKKDDDKSPDTSAKSKSKSKTDSKADSKSRNDRDDRDDPPARSTASTSRPSRAADDDSMWDNEEYDGYNSDGTFGRPAGATAQRRSPPAADPNDNPYTAPFGGPNYDNYGGSGGGGYSSGPQQPDPYGTPQNQGTASFIGDPYGSPAPTYAQPDYGQSYGGSVDMSHYDSPSSYGALGPSTDSYGSPDPYGSSYGSPYDSGAGASTWSGGGDPWGSGMVAQAPQSQYQASPSVDAQGSPQFENAVRMVKENRFSEAKSILSSETSRNPSNAAAWRWLADCHYNLLELDDAVSCYQRSLERDPNDYYALRGQGFAYLHRGHEQWRRMQDEVARGQKETAAATFAQAHENYKKSLEMLGLCLRRAPNDGEAIYGEAMAAEGASRKLYSNAISYLKLGPDQRERAELFASNCITVINKGVERSRERAKQNPGEAGPRALLGGLYLRKAILYHQLGKNDLALIELRNSRDVQQSIIDEIDKNNPTALKNIREVETYWEEWGGNR